MNEIPDTATLTIRAGQLIPGHIVLMPMTESMETVTRVRATSSHVVVHTNRTGPDSAYQWPFDTEIEVAA